MRLAGTMTLLMLMHALAIPDAFAAPRLASTCRARVVQIVDAVHAEDWPQLADALAPATLVDVETFMTETLHSDHAGLMKFLSGQEARPPRFPLRVTVEPLDAPARFRVIGTWPRAPRDPPLDASGRRPLRRAIDLVVELVECADGEWRLALPSGVHDVVYLTQRPARKRA